MRVLHLEAGAGAAGDMLLAALIDAGADLDAVRAAVSRVAPDVTLTVEPNTRAGLRALRLIVESAGERDRPWASIRADLASAAPPPGALATFDLLARAEARVHGIAPDDVRFHEVGAWDSIADIVGACAAVSSLGPHRITCGPIGTGTGTVSTHHGLLPVPTPAVLEVLAGSRAHIVPGPAAFEALTPTGAALLRTLVDEWVAGPDLQVERVGVGAGAGDPSSHANVVRAIVGRGAPAEPSTDEPGADERADEPGTDEPGGDEAVVVIETNIDDMDPRLWPGVLTSLLRAGASDAWLTPILMKKGRPAHTLHVLTGGALVPVVAREILRRTTAIGMRVGRVGKVVADRRVTQVVVDAQPIRVKVAEFDGATVNVQPEWEDVEQAASALGLTPKEVLGRAVAASRTTDERTGAPSGS